VVCRAAVAQGGSVIIELRAAPQVDEVTRLVDALNAAEDIEAWPVWFGDRGFVVVSGDEDLVPDVTSPVVAATHSTPDGLWLVKAGVTTPVTVGGREIARSDDMWWAAGPCALERFDDALETAMLARDQGADAIRMGLYKPRSSPYHFPGKQRAGLEMLAEVRRRTGLPVVTEVMDPREVEAVAEVADCLQVDPRNMTNRPLLVELGRTSRPVLLMRGLGASVTGWLRAAEYLMAQGNQNVILCARGVLSADDSLAFQPDYGAVLEVRRRTDLPVVFDPSHSTGSAAAVAPAAIAAAAFGVDGLIVETHVRPERIYRPGDAKQMYPPTALRELVHACEQVRQLTVKLGR